MGVGRQPFPRDADLVDEYVPADVCDRSDVEQLVRKVQPKFVFHLAGAVEGHVAELYEANFFSAFYLLEALRSYCPEARVLVVGSAAEYGSIPFGELPVTEERACRPVSSYGATKHAMTLAALQYAQSYSMKVTIARPFNIVGAGIPRHLVVGAILFRAREALRSSVQPVVKVGNLESERDFVAVTDVVDAYLRMLFTGHWGEVFNLCSGQPRSIRSVVDILLSHLKRSVRLETDAALVRPGEPKIVYGDSGKARRAFGFKPSVPLETALRDACEFESLV